MNLKFNLEADCEYDTDDAYCHNGVLYAYQDMLEGAERVCPNCKGRGKVLTEEGKELIEILKHYLT